MEREARKLTWWQHPDRRSRRRGGITPFVLISFGVFMVALAVAVDTARLFEAQTALRGSLDAAALAAARALVDDDLLRKSPNPSLVPDLLDWSRQQATALAQANAYSGQGPQLDPASDIAFGFINHAPPGTSFQGVADPEHLCLDAGDFALPCINAVRVTARRSEAQGNAVPLLFSGIIGFNTTDMTETATALVDRDVIGFRPLGEALIPLAPIGLRKGPFIDPRSWDYQVANGPDLWSFDRQGQSFAAGLDGISELTFDIPLAGQAPLCGDLVNPPACLLVIGTGFTVPGSPPGVDWTRMSHQISEGIGAADLTSASLGGQLVLSHFDDQNADADDGDDRLVLPVSVLAPAQGSDQLVAALHDLRQSGQPRVWPLFTDYLPSEGVVVVRGFVAARVIQAEVIQTSPMPGLSCSKIRITLQPATMATGTAITDAGRRAANPGLFNRYICKVRLEE